MLLETLKYLNIWAIPTKDKALEWKGNRTD